MIFSAVLDELLPDLSGLHFANGLPGFPSLRRFDCKQWGEPGSPFVMLSSVERPQVEFVAMPPGLFFPSYDPELTRENLAFIAAESPAEVLVLVILTLGPTPEDATANLLGPLLINKTTGEAVQAVLAGSKAQTAVSLSSSREE
jgi:flagellar assembly factor FliW